LAEAIRRYPVLPLPGAGALVQPIHIDDVAACLVAAVTRPDISGTPIVIAGPQPMRYADMVRAVGAARGLRAWVLPVPALPIRIGLASVGRFRPFAGIAGLVRRLLEDKDFDIAVMRERLGVEPREFRP
jgi:NADH dehydrogenase